MAQSSLARSTGSVLNIPATTTEKKSPKPAKKPPKPVGPRLKLLVRRLPPGLTQPEFENALGEEWRVGSGRVDWFQYRPGKLSKGPAKPSRPSRAYIHVTSGDHILSLSDKIRQTSFLDARNTANDAVLLGPPTLEFAPYAKTPGCRVRRDARQDTIDQDPEFIAFLESLTQPISKPIIVDPTTSNEEKEASKITTPLVQFIKDKKANKAKESVAARAAKYIKPDKELNLERVQTKKLLQRPGNDEITQQLVEKAGKKLKVDKAGKEAMKVVNQRAPNTSKQHTKGTTPAADRRRERGSAAIAAKILQRDLGLEPPGDRRKAGKASNDIKCLKAETAGETDQKIFPRAERGRGRDSAKPSAKPKASEALLKVPPDESSRPASTPSGQSALRPVKTKTAGVTPTATQAFLKHANPSQGVTEALLESTFASYGEVVRVEIDRKKGFAYIDFAEPAELQRAIAASPVAVAGSQVVVLERKLNVAEKGRRANKFHGEGRGQGRGRGVKKLEDDPHVAGKA